MTTTDDPDEFKRKWNSHIDELEALKLSVPFDQIENVDELIEDAKELVEAGAENVGDDDADG